MRCRDCDCIKLGDVVEHKMNTNVFGIVIGFMGSLVVIRVSPSLEVLQFHDWELDFAEDDEPPAPDSAEDAPTTADVIDFTKERKLRKTTTTRGAA
jgi:hypothetical protein